MFPFLFIDTVTVKDCGRLTANASENRNSLKVTPRAENASGNRRRGETGTVRNRIILFTPFLIFTGS
ncbi:hypothetical protein JW948_17690, partial [bacterium]|nr:hypothetical protein [bacterium]